MTAEEELENPGGRGGRCPSIKRRLKCTTLMN
jgi:hypothetical protein